MQIKWNLICFSLCITSGYAEENLQPTNKDLQKQMSDFKNEILVAISQLSVNMISQLSENINRVSNKVDTLENKIANMEGQMSSIEVDAEVVNMKTSIILPNVITLLNNVSDMAVSIESLGNEVRILRNNITLVEREQDNRIINHFEGMNFTLSSLETNMKGLFENTSLIVNEQEHKLVNNSSNMITEIGSMKNKLDVLAKNLSMIDIQQDNIIVSIETNMLSLGNIYSNISTKMSSVDQKISDVNTNMINIFHNITEEMTLINTEVGMHHDSNTEKVTGAIQDGFTTMISNYTAKKNISQMAECPRNCADIYKKGIKTSGPTKIFPYSCSPDDGVSVMCDQHLDAGKWTLIQRRQDVTPPRENFYRSWADYVQGFGNLDGEFWMGLHLIHELTSQSKQELHITLEDYEDNKRWAKYEHMYVGSSLESYRLTFRGYSGDAGDSLAYHNEAVFTTFDQDNDDDGNGNCALQRRGGWWYKNCGTVNVNGLPNKGSDTPNAVGIVWNDWLGHDYSLRSTTMKIRPME